MLTTYSAAQATIAKFTVDTGVVTVGGTLLDASNIDAFSDLEALGYFVDAATYNSFLQ